MIGGGRAGRGGPLLVLNERRAHSMDRASPFRSKACKRTSCKTLNLKIGRASPRSHFLGERFIDATDSLEGLE